MITFKENFSLKEYNSFGLEAMAAVFFRFTETSELIDFIARGNLKNNRFLILGGGSNLLFASNFQGVVIQPGIQGIDIVEETEDSVIVVAGAGVNWDSLVEWSVTRGLHGIENLSLIPGTVGASPVQNIGAYGAELKDVFVKAESVYIDSGERVEIHGSSCGFGYRQSIFKGKLANKVIITRVWIKLLKNAPFKLDYGSVANEVYKLGSPSLQNIRDSIMNIRRSKLPDPSVLGNAGSFFKNPVIKRSLFGKLKAKFPDLVSYESEIGDMIKIPAGWLVEKAGWKGMVKGRAGVHHLQALVLVNLGGATGKEILDLAGEIESDVKKKFGISLEKEVKVVFT